MSNPFTAIETALINAGKFITGLATGFAILFAKEKALAPITASLVTKFVGDVESLIALAAPAAGEGGLNFPADSAAYTQFLVVKSDVVQLAAQIEKDIKAL